MLSATFKSPRAFLYLGMLIACCFPFIAIFGFRPFHQGFWNNESIMLALLFLSSLSGAWIMIGVLFRYLDFSYIKDNLLAKIWFAWIIWQIICTVLSSLPWRSWFGPPEQSEGLAWYLAVTLLMLQLSALWYSKNFRKILLTFLFAVMASLAVCHLISDEANNLLAGFFFGSNPTRFSFLLPYVWPDYLGYLAAWGWISLQITFPKIRLRWYVLISVLIFIILFASSNRAAFGLLSYALLISMVIRIARDMERPHFTIVSRAWRQLMMIACMLPVVWLIAAPYIPISYSNKDQQSLPIRIMYNHAAMTALAEEPSRLLFGKGWGQYEDDFFSNILLRDIRVYTNGEHKPNWSLVRNYSYHSHDMAAETLLALGFIGMVLWLLLSAIAVRKISSDRFWQVVPMLVAVTALQHLWFTMPQAMPFQALCWFLLIRHSSKLEPAQAIKSHFIWPPMAIVTALLIWSVQLQYDAMGYSKRLSDPFGQMFGEPVTEEFMKEDIKRGGDRLRANFAVYTKRMHENSAAVQPKHVELYRNYIEAMKVLSDAPTTGKYNLSSVLYGYNVMIVAFRNPYMAELRKEMSRDYFNFALRHTKFSPNREDMIAPFLKGMWEMESDVGHERLMGVIQQLLEINPLHRSALWLGGKVLSEQAGFEAQGLEMMQTALKLGADKVYPITDAEINEVKQRAP